MKKVIYLSLLLALFAVASAAQEMPPTPPPQSEVNQPAQTPSQPATQTAAPAQTEPSSQTSQSSDQVSTRQPLETQRKEGFWGKLNPFARKKYVQRQLDPIKGRVSELDELTEANAKMIRDVDSRASEGIRLADAKATAAGTRAVEADNKATQAHQTAQQASTRLVAVEQAVDKLDQFQVQTEMEIRFRGGQSNLSARAKEALDQLATPLKDDRGYIIEVQGFSPSGGNVGIQHSQRMAQSVVRYLMLNHDIPLNRIYVVGLGNAPMTDADGKLVRTRQSKVEISLLRNSIAELQPQSATTPAETSTQQANQPMPASDQANAPVETPRPH